MKKIPCKLILHGSFKEHGGFKFPSITEAKKYVQECWDRPYTIIKLNQNKCYLCKETEDQVKELVVEGDRLVCDNCIVNR